MQWQYHKAIKYFKEQKLKSNLQCTWQLASCFKNVPIGILALGQIPITQICCFSESRKYMIRKQPQHDQAQIDI